MNKLAFAAIAALALTAATSAFADDQVIQLGHGATVVVGANQASDSANSLAAGSVIQTGHGAAVVLAAGPTVVSTGAQLARNGETAPAGTVISFGPARYTVG